MPGRLTPAQRLTSADGVPTLLARAGVVILMAIAAAAGWAAGPDRTDSGSRAREVVSIDRLRGDLPVTAAEAQPKLRSAAALPRYRGSAGQLAPTPPEPVETPSATPTPTASPEATATPGATVVPVATPAPAPPAPTAAPPRSTPTPGPTFDSSG